MLYSMVTQSPELKLYNNQRIPMLGFGTWQAQANDKPIDQAVEHAIQQGYRLIDCAHVYKNEKQVGSAINKMVNESIVMRKDLFVTSKLWNTFHRPSMVEKACKDSLNDLQLDYLDLYLIHWPISMVPNEGLWPTEGQNSKIDMDAPGLMATWGAMEELVNKKLVKSIGLCNVNKSQLQQVIEEGKIKPAVVQMEVHPFCHDTDMLDYCARNEIVVMAYSPLGGHKEKERFLKNDTIQEIAKKEGLTPAQVLLLWNLSEGRVVIPKSTTKERIKENFEFLTKMQKLSTEEVDMINKMAKGKSVRTCDPEKIFNVKIF
eukprot:NODE_1049_length_1705_cov_0.321295.p1 type:complete len:317 gc:universal NODE_1049_length_1705_cov_0.321295:1294-344(-)